MWPQLAAWGGSLIGDGCLPHFTSTFASGVRVRGPYLATVYDLIPAYYSEEYLPRRRYRWLYHRYLRHLREATHLLAISETVRRDAAEYLKRPLTEISAVLPGVPPLPVPSRLSKGLEGRYLFVAATPQPHKNLGFAIEVVATLPASLRVPLAVTGWPDDPRWQDLFRLAQERRVDLQNLGHVDRQRLADLYAGAVVVLMPSLYEGFGLPVVEALSVGARVICSDRGALPEAAGEAAEVLPLELEIWRSRLLAALDGEQPNDPEGGRRWAATFTWERAARAMGEIYAGLS